MESLMTPVLAVLGVLLLLVAIPLGWMLAPFVLGVALIVVVSRRAHSAIQTPTGRAA
jgi:hypothetical protein